MAKPYKQLGYLERKRIEEGLNLGYSFRRIADEIDRSPSTISHEVYENRIRKRFAIADKRHCSEKRFCEIKGICGNTCPYKGEEICAECSHVFCVSVCMRYKRLSYCQKLNRSPWVCNGCKRRGICRTHKGDQWLYLADSADAISRARRSEARRGFDMDKNEAVRIFRIIREHLKRGLSPYEISVLCKDVLNCSQSTIYRWIDQGFGEMCNLDLERKVGFKKRKKYVKRVSKKHTSKRYYDQFLALDEDIRTRRCEMDTVIGKKYDDKCLLTLFHKPTQFQFVFLLPEKTEDEVLSTIKMLKKICTLSLFEKLFAIVLTDNGAEFADEYRLSRAFGERRNGELKLYYCDVRASNQKGSCEKNHSELRQILPKGSISFDDLSHRDIAVAMSHLNSNPRAALCGMSPIAMFKAMFKEEGEDLLDALGVEEIASNELTLKPWILNIERDKRGEELLQILV